MHVGFGACADNGNTTETTPRTRTAKVVLCTVDLGGQPEQAATDDKGTVYVNILDKGNIAVVDAKSLPVKKHIDLSSKGVMKRPVAGRQKPHSLFLLATAIARGGHCERRNRRHHHHVSDGPECRHRRVQSRTKEAISTAGEGTMIFIKENSPASFEVEQRLPTMPGARTMVLDSNTNHVVTMAFAYGPLAADAKPPVPGRLALGTPLPIRLPS